MFKIKSLSLFGVDTKEPFTYLFTEGINYFKGPNDSGKTEFYTFLDYMFGMSDDLSDKEWYRDTLDYAELSFEKDGLTFILTRYLTDINKNYFRYDDETIGEPIRRDEYQIKLNTVFSPNNEALKELRAFMEEDVSYRTFTLFNFLGETRQGILQDFFDKSTKINYALKLPSILNYVFNRNLVRINELKKREEYLKKQLDKLEKSAIQNNDVLGRVNHQLHILGMKKVFTGTNTFDILHVIDELQYEIQKSESATKSNAISELEAIYTSLDEQIKCQKNLEYDHRNFELDDKKQKVLLERLEALLVAEPAYSYLIQPISDITKDLNRSISFNKYLIQENSTRELKKQREKIKAQIIANKSRFKIYSASDKTRAVTLVKEYLELYDKNYDGDSLLNIKRELKQVRDEIRVLQNSNDTEKINKLSADITRLYKSSADASDLAEFDFRRPGFQIQYFKKGNLLQPQIKDYDENVEEQVKSYYTGSMARHTLIQMCGYLAFMKLLLSENKYPLIPILVSKRKTRRHMQKQYKSVRKYPKGLEKLTVRKSRQYSEGEIGNGHTQDGNGASCKSLGISPS